MPHVWCQRTLSSVSLNLSINHTITTIYISYLIMVFWGVEFIAWVIQDKCDMGFELRQRGHFTIITHLISWIIGHFRSTYLLLVTKPGIKAPTHLSHSFLNSSLFRGIWYLYRTFLSSFLVTIPLPSRSKAKKALATSSFCSQAFLLMTSSACAAVK